jgi:hypothetical protein
MLKIFENDETKIVKSEDYNYIFFKKDGTLSGKKVQGGFFARWGKNKDDDPQFCTGGPELLDLEVSTICSGIPQSPSDKTDSVCKFCYKSNTPNGKNMSFETFKKIIDKLPRIVCQIAIGADSHATSNPFLFQMMEYSRKVGIIPNITVADITDETATKLAKVCGAVAVSRYDNKDICYNSVKRLTDAGLSQVNIHQLVCLEKFDNIMETLKDKTIDPRLEKLQAIVLLSLKKKGRGKSFTQLPFDKFKQIIDFALENKISVGMDSCSCVKFLKCVKDSPNFAQFNMVAEPCESGIFSFYGDVEGMGYPCSFTPGESEDWKEGLDMANCQDFVKDIWNHPKTLAFREKLLNTVNGNDLKCRECPIYDI